MAQLVKELSAKPDSVCRPHIMEGGTQLPQAVHWQPDLFYFNRLSHDNPGCLAWSSRQSSCISSLSARI